MMQQRIRGLGHVYYAFWKTFVLKVSRTDGYIGFILEGLIFEFKIDFSMEILLPDLKFISVLAINYGFFHNLNNYGFRNDEN